LRLSVLLRRVVMEYKTSQNDEDVDIILTDIIIIIIIVIKKIKIRVTCCQIRDVSGAPYGN